MDDELLGGTAPEVTTHEETPPVIQNPQAVLRALESAKADKAKLAAEVAEMQQKLAEIQQQSQAEIKKRDEVLGEVLRQIDPSSPHISTSAADLLTTFQATERLEALRKQAQTEGEQRALERVSPQLEQARKDAERAQQELQNLQKFQKFQNAFLSADGKPENLEGVYQLYGRHFNFDEGKVTDLAGNTIFNESTSKPVTPTEALQLMRQGKLQGIPSPELGQSAFVPYNQATGGATPATRRMHNGSRVLAFDDLTAALKSPALSGLTANQIADKVRNGEIIFDSK